MHRYATRESLAPPEADPRDRVSADSRRLQRRAHALIPGGCHTYSKGDDQYPRSAPPFIERGLGCHVWDTDGREFIEYGMGLRAVVLGHAYPEVVAAAAAALARGSNFTRPSPLEVRCAETFLELVPTAEMVKFAKNGSDVTTAAVKLARAWTGRDLVAVCADQPFFSTDDWFIGVTPMSAGVPEAAREMTLSFRYNDLDSLRDLFARHPNQIAAVVLEPACAVAPEPGYLEGLRELCTAAGALLVFDEMITGIRWGLGGAQGHFGVTPDLSAFGKGIGNGFAIAALAGRRDVMEMGGLSRSAEERVFLLSTTHGAETHSLAAAIATMNVCRREGVPEVLARRGEELRAGVRAAAESRGLADHVHLKGHPANLVFVTRDREGVPSQAYRTLFLQELIRRGVLGPSFVVSYSHSPADVAHTLEAVEAALEVYAMALVHGVEPFLEGPPSRPVFGRAH